jgi:hypothetical protein
MNGVQVNASVLADETPKILTIRPERLALKPDTLETTAVRDPFSWPALQISKLRAAEEEAEADPFSNLNLSGIIWDKERPLAIINDQLVGKGDHINNTFVEDITKEAVLVTYKGKGYNLEFEPFLLELRID